MRIITALLIYITLTPGINAGEISHNIRIPLHQSIADGSAHHSQSWYDVVYITPFNTSLGTLNTVSIEITQLSQFQFFYENLATFTGTTTSWERISSKITLKKIGQQKPIADATLVLNNYSVRSGQPDGIIDWGGSGGHTSHIIQRIRTDNASHRSDINTLQYFSQNTVPVDVYGNSRFVFNSFDYFWAMGMRHKNSATVKVTYHYQ
jgi:hypothetical protein